MSDSWSWLDPNNWNLDPSTWSPYGSSSSTDNSPLQMFIGTTQSQPTTMPQSPSGSGAAEGASTPSLSPSQQAQQDQAQQQQDQWDTSGTNKMKTPSFGEWLQSKGDWLFSKEGAASLQKGAESLKSPESTAAPKGATINSAQMGSGSQVVPGNSGSLMNLLQMLSNRRYLPMGYSGGSGSSTRGLLGY